jgi:6-pyruvoyl-tetrahydropterin synthase
MSAERVICASHEYFTGLKPDEPVRPLHGHNWRIIAHIRAEHLDGAGRVLPVEVFEDEFWNVLAPFDHRHLNDLGDFDKPTKTPPTAAGLARLVGEQLAARLDDGRVRVQRIEVSPRAGVTISWEQS